jgi:hypothetical protein
LAADLDRSENFGFDLEGRTFAWWFEEKPGSDNITVKWPGTPFIRCVATNKTARGPKMVDMTSREGSDDAEVDSAPPKPAALIESLRAFGYDSQTAIADLIDNSIAARAKNIWIDFVWNGTDSSVSIRDDGKGMSEKALVDAMRIGSRSPKDPREPGDLGRFGLGLKTSSFSQCRLLTVASKQAGSQMCTRTWDLDFVEKRDEWLLLRSPPAPVSSTLHALDSQQNGTVIVWSALDRMVGTTSVDNRQAEDAFYRTADQIRDHVAMVFGDYLRGRGAISIHVSGHPVVPWDPFLVSHESIQILPVEPLNWKGNDIQVTPYVLPHHTRMSASDWEKAAGIHGWNAHQGFYVFRNGRLLVAGDWLGLGFTKEEHYKLARIRIDLSSGSDFDWSLDVKKSRAWPPNELRERLRRIARLTRARAAEVYRHRGRKLVSASQGVRVLLWDTLVKQGKTFYRLNRQHPIIEAALRSAEDSRVIKALLRLVEETVPLPLIYINTAEQPKAQYEPFDTASTMHVRAVMEQVLEELVRSGLTPNEARLKLAHIDPFDRFPDLLATIGEEQPVGYIEE